jgi:hypothetical protein
MMCFKPRTRYRMKLSGCWKTSLSCSTIFYCLDNTPSIRSAGWSFYKICLTTPYILANRSVSSLGLETILLVKYSRLCLSRPGLPSRCRARSERDLLRTGPRPSIISVVSPVPDRSKCLNFSLNLIALPSRLRIYYWCF